MNTKFENIKNSKGQTMDLEQVLVTVLNKLDKVEKELSEIKEKGHTTYLYARDTNKASKGDRHFLVKLSDGGQEKIEKIMNEKLREFFQHYSESMYNDTRELFESFSSSHNSNFQHINEMIHHLPKNETTVVHKHEHHNTYEQKKGYRSRGRSDQF